MLKNHIKRGFVICMLATGIVLGLSITGWLDTLELKTVDYRFQWRGERPVSSDIVVIDIDEKSIEEMGRWPWKREVHGDLIEKLNEGGAHVIAFDTLFTERDNANPDSDLALADMAAVSENVVSAAFFKEEFDGLYGSGITFPYEELDEVTYSGFVNFPPDHDGITRHARLFAIGKSDGSGETAVYPSLAVAALALSEGKTFEEILKELPVFVSADHNLARNKLFINYGPGYGVENNYSRVSYTDIIHDRVDLQDVFQDKVVFIGATATTLFDLKAIPFTNVFPGVFTHANVLDNLMNKSWVREVSLEITLAYIISIGLLLGFVLPRLSTWSQLAVFILVVSLGLSLSFWLFSSSNLVVHMVPPLFTALGSYGGILFYRLIVEEREKRKIKGSFKQYLSPKIIDVITKDPSKLKLGGEEREVTIFFLDIAGFTTMSEALKPSQLVEVMNQCLTKFSQIILKHDGLINKYIGDCIMAFWNSPLDQEKHASLACYAALDCIAAISELNEDFKKKGLPSIDCRVGVNTGTVVVGNMGSSERFDYTVMGDPVNLASRLEGANKQYQSHIMISESTFEQAKNDIEARDLDLIRVKGKKEPKKVFELLCKKGQMSSQLNQGRQKYHNALRLYRQAHFTEAIAAFQEVFDFLPNDHLTLKYLERARTFEITPPPQPWDGVFEMKTK